MHRVVVWVQEVLVPLLGAPGLFLVAFLDSSFLSLPEINDILVVTSAAAHPPTAWVAAAMATLGSVVGCAVLWELGRRGGEAVLVRRFGRERVDRTRAAFHRFDVLALAIPALLPPPMPFKIFVLSAGVFGFPFRRFVATLAIARGLRYAFWAGMGAAYGDEARLILLAVDAWFAERAMALLLGLLLLLAALLVVMTRRRSRAVRAARDAGRLGAP
jgi:membrane protein YqaA with SNARE-associated domain